MVRFCSMWATTKSSTWTWAANTFTFTFNFVVFVLWKNFSGGMKWVFLGGGDVPFWDVSNLRGGDVQDQVIHNPFMWAVIFIYGHQYVSSLNPLRWLRAKTDKKEKVQRKGLLKEKDLKCKRREMNGPTWKINICFSVSALTCNKAVNNLNCLITFRTNFNKHDYGPSKKN